jgi:CO dehydrogenase nickel-insertion accessory protein CooC1
MRRHLDEKKIIGSIPKDDLIFVESLEGRKLTQTLPEIDRICDRIIGRA